METLRLHQLLCAGTHSAIVWLFVSVPLRTPIWDQSLRARALHPHTNTHSHYLFLLCYCPHTHTHTRTHTHPHPHTLHDRWSSHDLGLHCWWGSRCHGYRSSVRLLTVAAAASSLPVWLVSVHVGSSEISAGINKQYLHTLMDNEHVNVKLQQEKSDPIKMDSSHQRYRDTWAHRFIYLHQLFTNLHL